MHITALCSRDVFILFKFDEEVLKCKHPRMYEKWSPALQSTSNKRKYIYLKYWFPLLRSGVLVSLWISSNVFHGSSVLLVETDPRSMVMQSSRFYYISVSSCWRTRASSSDRIACMKEYLETRIHQHTDTHALIHCSKASLCLTITPSFPGLSYWNMLLILSNPCSRGRGGVCEGEIERGN